MSDERVNDAVREAMAELHPEFPAAVIALVAEAKIEGASTFDTSRQARWDADMAAYRAMRARGLQPPSVAGCELLADMATTDAHVEAGTSMCHVSRVAFEWFQEAFGVPASESTA